MTFSESISTCFTKYIDFTGRASRSEYWWFILFSTIVQIVLHIVNDSGVLGGLFSLAVIVPTFAVQARRLHDTNRSAWFILLNLIPIIGWIILLIWFVQKSDEESNLYGAPPTLGSPAAPV